MSTTHQGTTSAADRRGADYQPNASGRGQFARAEIALALQQLVLSQKRVVVIVTGVVIALVVTALLLVPRRYTSSASFIVEAPPNSSMSGAMAIISQLNPSLAGGDSPKFYVDLVQSRPVLENLLHMTPREQCGRRNPETMLDRLTKVGDDSLERLATGVKILSGRVQASYDLRTGVIGVAVEADCPLLARELTDSLIAAVNTFNVERRQTRAKLRREFSDQQATQAEADLRAAEDQLAAFLATNRMIESPQLRLENDRLQRRVASRSEIASSLRRDAATARLDEINSMPALTVIEPPSTPTRASFPKRRVIVAAAGIVALGLGVALALLLSFLRPVPANATEATRQFHARARGLLHLPERQ